MEAFKKDTIGSVKKKMAFSHVPSGLTRRNMYTPSRKDSTTTLPRISVAGKKNIMPFLRPKSFKKIDSTPLYTKNDPNIVLSRTQTASIAMRMRGIPTNYDLYCGNIKSLFSEPAGTQKAEKVF